MIRVENVSKSFGSKKALYQISFEIKEGEIFGFLDRYLSAFDFTLS